MKTKARKSLFLPLLTLSMVCALLFGLSATVMANGETATAAQVGSYTEKSTTQDVTVRLTINELSAAYDTFSITSVTVPEGFTLKSISSSYTTQPITGGDYNTSGQLSYNENSAEANIPGNTTYDYVFTAPANAKGTYSFTFNGIQAWNNYGSTQILNIPSATATLTISAAPVVTGYTVAMNTSASSVEIPNAVNVDLNVTNSSATVTAFNAFYATLSYNADCFTYNVTGSSLGDFTVVDSSTPGTLTISRSGSAITIPGTGNELRLAFTAVAAGTGAFTLSSAKVDAAANAEEDAPAATISGSPANVTVTAPIVTYAVTFVKGADDATGTAPTVANKAEGAKFNLPTNTFTRDNYNFTGWNDGTSTYAAGDEYTMGNTAVTFTAQWAIKPPQVSVSTTTAYLNGYTLIKATVANANGNVPTYDGNTMYKLTGFTGDVYDSNTYYYIVVTSNYNATKIGYVTASDSTLTKTADVNQTGLIDINDAQFVYNIYNGTAPTTNLVARLLLADVNNDGKIDSFDCAAAVAAIQ